MKILMLDTYYPDVLRAKGLQGQTYAEHLKGRLDLLFGTSSFYSDAFRQMGWEASDVIANDEEGRRLWCQEDGRPFSGTLASVQAQIAKERPDVVYCQDLTFLPRACIENMRRAYGTKFVAQHSCPWAGDAQVGAFDLVYSSFPHYLPRIEALGVEAAFLPIAFGAQVLHKVPFETPRLHDVTFVGGINAGSGHWRAGTDVLVAVARELGSSFKWWGYVIGDQDRMDPHLRAAYQGPAWGADMYRIYGASKIVVNRHGEVAEGYSNNMRMFEATGMGALLLTERSKNIEMYFQPGDECLEYVSADNAVHQIKSYLNTPTFLADVADRGQRRTLAYHTYDKRLVRVESKLREMIS